MDEPKIVGVVDEETVWEDITDIDVVIGVVFDSGFELPKENVEDAGKFVVFVELLRFKGNPEKPLPPNNDVDDPEEVTAAPRFPNGDVLTVVAGVVIAVLASCDLFVTAEEDEKLNGAFKEEPPNEKALFVASDVVAEIPELKFIDVGALVVTGTSFFVGNEKVNDVLSFDEGTTLTSSFFFSSDLTTSFCTTLFVLVGNGTEKFADTLMLALEIVEAGFESIDVFARLIGVLMD